MTAKRTPQRKSDSVALELPANLGDDQTRPAPSRNKRIVDYWPAAALIVGLVANIAWVLWLLWLAAELIF